MTVVLVLGGTAEARACAAALLDHGFDVVTSLAGRVREPKLPRGRVRTGGFGGPQGLADWLVEHEAAAVVDATHPFAERIGSSAVTACAGAAVPLLRLDRPGWQATESDTWHWVDSLPEAAERLPHLGRRAFLTTGRQGLAAFATLRDTWMLIRCVDPPAGPLPPHSEVLLSRGPYDLHAERSLLSDYNIDVVVTKDSGAAMTTAKLTAARELGLPVLMVRRPERPDVPSVTDPDAVVRWVAVQTRDPKGRR